MQLYQNSNPGGLPVLVGTDAQGVKHKGTVVLPISGAALEISPWQAACHKARLEVTLGALPRASERAEAPTDAPIGAVHGLSAGRYHRSDLEFVGVRAGSRTFLAEENPELMQAVRDVNMGYVESAGTAVKGGYVTINAISYMSGHSKLVATLGDGNGEEVTPLYAGSPDFRHGRHGGAWPCQCGCVCPWMLTRPSAAVSGGWCPVRGKRIRRRHWRFPHVPFCQPKRVGVSYGKPGSAGSGTSTSV